MIKLELEKDMMGLDGKPLVDPAGNKIQMNKILADVLVKSGEGEAMKLYDLAHRIFNNAKVEVDQSDFDTIRTALSASNLQPLFKAPILRALDSSKK